MPRREPRKKKSPHENPKSDSQTPPSSLRRFWPGHIMIEIPYSGVIKDISFIMWPGKNRRSELGGVWGSDFGFLWGGFFCGALRGAFCGA